MTKAVLVLTGALWAAVFVQYTVSALTTPEFFWRLIPYRLVTCASGFILCMLLYAWLSRHLERRLWVQVLLGVGGSILTGLAHAVAATPLYFLMMEGAASVPSKPGWWLSDIIGRHQGVFWIYLCWACLFIAYSYSRRLQASEIRLLEAEALSVDSQNRMLRYQINPHFLFNTINAVSSLVLRGENAKAESVLQSLADFLRYSLTTAPDMMVSLEQEVSAQVQYLRIEQARFGERLKLVVDVDEAADVMAPTLILQPLVENAVKYAVAPATGPVTITLRARRSESGWEIEVSDDGAGQAAGSSGLGVGLENVRRRLELLYGDAATFRHGPRRPTGYFASITLPAADHA